MKTWMLYHALITLRHNVPPAVMTVVCALRDIAIAAMWPREAAMFLGLDARNRGDTWTVRLREYTVLLARAFPDLPKDKAITPNLHYLCEHAGDVFE